MSAVPDLIGLSRFCATVCLTRVRPVSASMHRGAGQLRVERWYAVSYSCSAVVGAEGRATVAEGERGFGSDSSNWTKVHLIEWGKSDKPVNQNPPRHLAPPPSRCPLLPPSTQPTKRPSHPSISYYLRCLSRRLQADKVDFNSLLLYPRPRLNRLQSNSPTSNLRSRGSTAKTFDAFYSFRLPPPTSHFTTRPRTNIRQQTRQTLDPAPRGSHAHITRPHIDHLSLLPKRSLQAACVRHPSTPSCNQSQYQSSSGPLSFTLLQDNNTSLAASLARSF